MILGLFYKNKKIIFLSILLIIFSSLIYLRYFFVTSRSGIMLDRENRFVSLRGEIVEEVTDFGFKKSFVVEVLSLKVNGIYVPVNENDYSVLNIKKYFNPRFRKNKIRVISSCGDCDFGDEVIVSGTLSLPKVTDDFDSDIFLLSRGIQFEIVDGKIIKSVFNKKYQLRKSLYDFKNLFVDKIKLSLKDREESALGSGILITGKGELSKKTLEDFKRAGLVHMVVLSGFNVSIVSSVIISVLSFLPKIFAGVFGSIGIILFCMMVGGGATVIRSLLMSLIVIFSKVFYLETSALKAVLFAGGLMLINNPLIIVGDPSFQLSFACTLGIILLGNSSKYFFNFITDKMTLREIVSSSFATQIFALPLLLKFSGTISVYGIFANIIVVPIIPLAMITVFFMGVLCFINFELAMVFSIVSHILLSYILFVARYISSIQSSVFEVGKVGNTFVLYWYIVLLPVSIFLYRKF